jgi:hypothetical protein
MYVIIRIRFLVRAVERNEMIRLEVFMPPLTKFVSRLRIRKCHGNFLPQSASLLLDVQGLLRGGGGLLQYIYWGLLLFVASLACVNDRTVHYCSLIFIFRDPPIYSQ